MALAVVQQANGGQASNSTTGAATFGTTTLAGSLLVVCISRNDTSGASISIADSTGTNTYVIGPPELHSGIHDKDIYYCKNAAANAGTVTVTSGATAAYFAVSIYEVTGADLSAPLDTTSGANSGVNGSGTSLATSTLTLAGGNEIIFAIAVFDGPPGSAGTGYTGVNFAVTGDAGLYFLSEYHIVSANEAATATQITNTTWHILAAAFKVASAGFTAVNRRTLGPRVGSRSLY